MKNCHQDPSKIAHLVTLFKWEEENKLKICNLLSYERLFKVNITRETQFHIVAVAQLME